MTTQPTLLDQLVAGVGAAITDIREKVVEEPWFGRVVTQSHEPPIIVVGQDRAERADREALEPDININEQLGMDR